MSSRTTIQLYFIFCAVFCHILVRIWDFQVKLGESRQDRDGWTVWVAEIGVLGTSIHVVAVSYF